MPTPTTAPAPHATVRGVARTAGRGAHAGPRICAWCHAPIADDADADAFGGAELHRPCAGEFALWANEDATPAPFASDDC